MKTLRRLRDWWRGLWAKKLGWGSDPFHVVLGDLTERLLIVEKRCEALTPSEWLYRGER